MLNIFGRKKSAKAQVQSPIKKINEAALDLIASANEGNRGTRLVTSGAALEIVRRSLVKTDGQSFSVQKVHALKEVSEYISLAQRNKVVTASAAHFDLLPIGHPSAKRDHRLSREDLLRARARWFADDSLVVDDNVQSLLATAFIADPESPEHQYAVARLTAMGAHRVPVEALVAAALGFNDGANRGFWRQQIRDRKGQFAKMGGTIRTLLRMGGQVFPQYTTVVSTNSNDGTVRSMQPDGRLIESSATSIDTDVVALIPGTEQPDGVGTSPARFDSTDPIVEEADLKYVNEPHGFLPKGAPFSPRGLDPKDFDRVWEDDLGNYQVIRGNFRDGEEQDYVVSRLEQDDVVPIGVGKNWAEVVDIVDTDEPKFQEGDDAEPNIPDGFDIGPAPREEIDPANLSPDELAAGYGWSKSGNKYERDNFEIEQLPNGKWLLTEVGEEGAFRESGPFDGPAEAFEEGQLEAGGPEFDPGQVIDFREDQGPDEAPEPEAPEPTEPGGFYEVDRGPYAPKGPQDGVESDNYSDDPVELAQNYDPEELEGALEEAVRNGSGEALIPFEEGDEYVPAEALYNALKEQDRDPDRLLDDIYEGTEPTPATEEVAPDLEEDEDQESITPEQIAEMRGETDLPALLDALSDEELAEVMNNEDYSAYLPQNEEFDVPEGMYELNPDSLDANEEFAPADAPEDAPATPIDLALAMSSEDLEQLLRGAVNGEYGRLGYGKINMPDADGEDFEYDVPAEAIRDALQLQGIDTNDILRETYDGGEPTADEIDQMVENEEIEDGGEPGADSDGAGPSEGEGTLPESGDDGRGLGDGESPWSSLDNPVPEAARAAELRENNKPTPEIFELDPEADAKAYVRMMEGLKENNKYASSVFIYELDEYKEMRLFSTADGKAGFALKPNGDIVSVYIYADSDHRGGVQSMLAQAVELGGDRLDAYDTVLPAIYAEAGFKPVARVRWDKNFEPDGWNKETYKKYNKGEPDVVAMAYDPDRIDSKYDPAEGEYFDDYEEAMAARDAFIDGDAPDAGDSPLGRTYDISDWEQVGGQTGSNEGGLYRDAEGNEYYVKFPPQKQLRNELLASALYEKAGVPVGRVYLGRDADGNEVLVSPMLENPEPLRDNLDNPDAIEQAQANFAADAWLNNWDSVGLVFDNMVVADSEFLGRELYRIDAGGALLFRAQGGDKELPEDVKLIDSLRNPDVNQQAATVYGGMTDEDIKFSVQKMLPGATDENIDELVDAAFPDDTETANLLKDRLKSRRDYLVERFKPVTPDMAEQAAEGAARDYAEQLQEAQEKVDEAFANNPLVLDFDGDIEAQINDALENERDLVFSYNGVDRIVRPVSIETNENTGNTNISAVDGEGNFKKFTISKMSVASNSDDTVDDVVGEDTAGDEIETSDSELPQSLEEWEQELLKVVDEMYSTENLTSQDVEDLGEQPDVNDDITSDFVQKIDSYDADAPQLETPEQKVMADTIEQLINPEEGADAPSTEQILEGANTPGNTEPDLIWQRVQDEYEGTLLPNGHVVVSSTMHNDRRYDVVVRRANNNTFHIYHRVTYPDGSTKVKEMGGQGWHSAEALFSRVETQIFNSKSRPKTTVNKGLKQENGNTLYADTSTPTQPGSYVAADGSVVKKGDRVTVVNPTHSKFGMGARIVSTKRKYSSDGKKYTDYLRVRYDDGTKNNIVATSVTPEGTQPAFPAESSSATTETTPTSGIRPTPLTVDNVSSLALGEPVLAGEIIQYVPMGAVVARLDGTRLSKDGSTSWSSLENPNVTVEVPDDEIVRFVSFNEYGGDAELPELTQGGEASVAGAPSSGEKTGDIPRLKSLPESYVSSKLYESEKTYGTGKDFQRVYKFENISRLSEGITKYYDEELVQTVELPTNSTGKLMLPGALTKIKETGDGGSVADRKSFLVTSTNFENATVSGVVLSGPNRGEVYENVNPDELALPNAFLSRKDAFELLDVDIPEEEYFVFSKANDYVSTPSLYRNEDIVNGPGFEAPEFEQLPSWSSSPMADVPSTTSILNELNQKASLGDNQEAGFGKFTLMDASSIEDGQVRIQRVIGEDGKPQIRLTGKLTSWAGRGFVRSVANNEISALETQKINLGKYGSNPDTGELAYEGDFPQWQVDKNHKGSTYEVELDEGKIRVYRALHSEDEGDITSDREEVDFFTSTLISDTPLSFHNMFDITLPENASGSSIQRALETMGVQQARPATEIDVRNIAENKLLWMFGKYNDGTKNPSGLLRQQELQKIQQEYGVTAADIEIVNDGTESGRVQYLLPEAVAQKLAKERADLISLYHNVTLSGVSNDVDGVAERLVSILTAGSLESTIARRVSGVEAQGMSSDDDIYGPGANHTFLYPLTNNNQGSGAHFNPNPTSNNSLTVVFDPTQLIRRMDYYANEGDGYGRMQSRSMDVFDHISGAEHNGEVMFKYNVPITSAVGIATSPEVKQRAIEILRERGIEELHGLDLEALINASVTEWR